MSTWAIGDLQGCYDATQRLLERIAFDPARDQLWFCGDLVNRGGQSLETLRLVHSLRANSVVVLGNHDLSLLAIGERREDEQRKVNPDLQRVVLAEDRDELLDLAAHAEAGARRPQARLDDGARRRSRRSGPRRWPRRTRARSRSACTATSSAGCSRTCTATSPAWHPKLAGIDRQRAIINVFTRLRYCTPRGRIAFEDKGSPGTQPAGSVSVVRSARPRRARPARSSAATGRRWACSSATACTRSTPARSGAASSPRCSWTPTNCASCRCPAATCRRNRRARDHRHADDRCRPAAATPESAESRHAAARGVRSRHPASRDARRVRRKRRRSSSDHD